MFNLFGGKNADLGGMVQSLMKEAGGLQGLKGTLESAGLGDAMNSWIGTGENQVVDDNQLADALGRDKIEKMAAEKGVDLKKILPLLATFLPLIIDKLTPDGDEAGADARIDDKQGLDDLMRDVLKSGLGKLFG
jgi:uncharacterized protein YidB (DUF937 family)